MKKIIISVAVATMALSTAASALEDIKVSGQAKLWYETNDKDFGASKAVTAVAATQGAFNTDGTTKQGTEAVAAKAAVAAKSGSMFNRGRSVAQQTFAIKVTGKQGNVGFGVKVIDSASMSALGGDRDNTANDGLTVSEMYVTAPLIANTTMKIGKQQIQTPLAFSENWMAVPNTFNAALIINKSIPNVTLVGAYVGQGNADNSLSQKSGAGFKVADQGTFSTYAGGKDTYAAIAHYKTDALGVNVYAYSLENIATALWVDASAKVGPVKVTGIAATINPDADADKSTKAYAISAAAKVASVSLSAAYSTVNDEAAIPMGNTATNFKKTKLPTAGVYTDGLYVAQKGSDAYKVKAVTKLAGTKVIAQYVVNNNSVTPTKETKEMDLILVKKLGDVNLKGILLNRSFNDSSSNATHVRVIASINF